MEGNWERRCWQCSKSEVKVALSSLGQRFAAAFIGRNSPPSPQARRATSSQGQESSLPALQPPTPTFNDSKRHPTSRQHGRRMESSWFDVRARPQSPDGLTDKWTSYNRYLAVSARVVRRSLREDARVRAERRGESDLRFAKWEVSDASLPRKKWWN